jgi:uncharacterized membrane protein YdjX (TVP38/TMEM64 family)
MKKFFTLRNILITILVVLVLAFLTCLLWEPASQFFGNKENLEKFIKSLGPWGPLVVVLLQVVQVVLAPIPGQFTSLASGFLYGWWGLALTIIGSTLGFMAVIALSRKFGRKLLEKFFKKEQIKKFDFVTNKGEMVLFLIFLLPAFPDDLIAYLAGLTKIPFHRLVIIAVVGRLPGYLVLNMMGSSVAGEVDMKLIYILVSLTAVILGLAYWQKGWLEKFIKSKNKLTFLKNTFKKTPKKKEK